MPLPDESPSRGARSVAQLGRVGKTTIDRRVRICLPGGGEVGLYEASHPLALADKQADDVGRQDQSNGSAIMTVGGERIGQTIC